MLKNQKNSRKQGDVGLGSAISYFCGKGYTVSLPLTESQEYDLVVEINGKLNKVQIKTTTFKTPHGIYTVALKTCGGNRSGQSIKKFDFKKVELLFVLTNDGDEYLIPTSEDMPICSLNLGERYQQYKVN